ncbi:MULTISPECIES: efflux RND transporter permease subunit [unclassified Methylophilus]|uniref:efflux RND transporter permease subunit n=1 Tax=unclassified Methylophilus TaxID=2630143 RepID=UPI000701DFCB|nr:MULTISPECIES: efflux RND transporter permease subunit [unclassified Methylophilus]KQT37255.1 multidrug transporter [Methylophilus sp. Leaf416]KQT55575.1 multidrug transporter [Methylophilus sp. Leaf459]
MAWLTLFLRRPIATTLLAVAIALPGIAAYFALPIASLPQVEMPSIDVFARLPGASAETMASAVASPLERSLGNIAGVNEMTSSSSKGQTRVSLQFDLDRNADGAARDVQAAINAAVPLLPAGMQSNPTWRKSGSNMIMHIALTSERYSRRELYDIGLSLIGQRISQVDGVGQVNVNGSALRSVRVEVNPLTAHQYGIALEQIRNVIANTNAHLPKGFVENDDKRWQLDVNDSGNKAADFEDLIVAWRNGAPIRLHDIADVKDSVQELRSTGSVNGKPGVVISVNNIPGTNIVATVDGIKALLPKLKPLLPPGIEMEVLIDRSTIVRKSLQEVEHTLLISIVLVILVTFVFLRSGRAALIPSIAIPVSLLGTLAVIYLCGFSLNNLTLMALIIATGFIVDDAIVVVENTMRHIEHGLKPLQAAFQAVHEVSFTIIAMSLSLIAAFIPLLFMDGVIGRIFREFSITLASAVVLSLLITLTLTPVLSSRLLKSDPSPNRLSRALASIFDIPHRAYYKALQWAIRHSALILVLFFVAIGSNVYLYSIVPKGFFPLQDTGRLQGNFEGDQNLSFWAMREKVDQFMRVIASDPDIETYYEYTGGFGGGQSNTGMLNARLKPRKEREASAQEIVDRLRPQLDRVAGASLRLRPQQEFNIGVRPGSAEFQYTLLSSNIEDLRRFSPQLRDALTKLPQLTDVSSDAQDKGLQANLVIDRDAAARLGITQRQIDASLNDAFGQRLVSTIYEPLNQYFIVLTLAPRFAEGPESLNHIYLNSLQNQRIPLSSIARWELVNTPLAVNHEGQFAAATISFNIAEGYALDAASQAIEAAFVSLDPPESIHGSFSGKAKAFKESMDSQPWLILTALVTIYIVLGILYESLIHPITILSTLPSAGIGALMALLLFDSELTIIAMIGIVLLIGIVMKNAIIMIDAARYIIQHRGTSPDKAIVEACMQRFRPILMTTFAAVLGALPLLFGVGDGAEIRQPLGISIVGGLLLGQVLTLFTTPVIYLYLDKLNQFRTKKTQRTTPVSTNITSV